MRGAAGAEVWFKLVLVALFAAAAVVARGYPPRSRQFPELIALVSLGLLAVSLLRDLTRRAFGHEIAETGDTELTIVDPAVRRERRRRVRRAGAIIAGSTALGFVGGFVVTVLLCYLGFAWFFGRRPLFLRNVAVAVAVTLAIYLLFDRVMAVPMLVGVWP
jgi:hypothetical protein